MLAFPDSVDASAIDPAFAVWATSWLAGDVATDDFLDEVRQGLYLADVKLWAQVREHLHTAEYFPETADMAIDPHRQTPIRLVLNGAGRVNALADGLYIAGAAGTGLYRIQVGAVDFLPDAELPTAPPLGAGDALYAMGDAADRAATIIENLGFRPIQAGSKWSSARAAGPAVAQDLPPGAPVRCLEIFSRAATLHNIVLTVRENLEDTSLDPMLLPLGAALRQGYEAAVEVTARTLL
ncbi:hypothetical protein [Corynebacterium aquilae]|uniref:Uncharacterized protein n=1 Tax=Corynebacterium aquilae DSM 44791 TaxID=1431546 RepID=A0A1L7CFY2_9CORY|nr:hypothetical protein [Corynebacterium aquilae]APT84780.1 hypothetical protein CAQU_06525 [Corynebacterium aquilae DSM 44791]